MPSVSVVIPNYNHARYLRARIESVLEQTWTDREVIILDDASTDNSVSIIQQYANEPGVRIVLNRVNSGSTFIQWNRGVREATGEYVWIAESDDLAHSRFLERVVGAMRAQGCSVGCCESWYLHGEGPPRPDNIEPQPHPPERAAFWANDFACDGATICIEDMLVRNALPNASAVVFRRALYEQVGGADESMRQAGDRMMWIRMLAIDRLAHVAERLNHFRFHDATVRRKTMATSRTIREVYAAVRFVRDHLPITPAKLEWALDGVAAHFARASARRGVPLADMIQACRNVSDVDPRIWSRLFVPWLVRRALVRPHQALRRTKHALRDRWIARSVTLEGAG